jgi:DNA mismatch repair protein MutL
VGIIQILNDQIANMIAAGEVVERPASVVKELVENSIDAGSSKIEVHIQEGGLSLITVSDNGSGMTAEDCKLSFERHATSKIRKDRDLFHIGTLGFRGEALPSIAAVSRMELVSCTADEEVGTRIGVEGGRQTIFETVAHPKGTEIRVRDLFFNTPARLKYLKSIQTEIGHVSDCLNRLALAYPTISFMLTSDGRSLLKTYGDGQLLHVIGSVYGMSTAKEMIPIHGESLDFRIKGYIGNPQLTRANRSYITILVNGRYVRSPILAGAIVRGYHTLLPINRFPIVVIDITMEPTLVDVNVHPAKLEVRLSKEQELTRLVEEEVGRVLRGQKLIPEPSRTPYAGSPSSQLRMGWNYSAKIDNQQDQGNPPLQIGETITRTIYRQPEYSGEYTGPTLSPARAADLYEQEQNLEAQTYKTPDSIEPKLESHQAPAVPTLQPLAQLHGTYILAQSEEGLFMIDQHAAQERIWYEYFLTKLKEEVIELQELLIPLSIELTVKEMKQVQEKSELLANVGIDLEFFGNQTFIVRAHPRWFVAGEEEAIIHEMVDMIVKGQERVDTIKLREKAAIMMACKAAIKANKYLSNLEMEALLQSLRTCLSPYTCPHGRPIIIHFSTYDIEKMFKRVM